ncbi:ATP-binding protein [Spirulina subsalsa]|uniref:ATP-binding protein n=1 Tax=Spirulina subsalsa TaxID=54311 RepID=UPI000310D8C3|nr:ATP-binding protein [Spirulina subsalsa]
MPTPVQKLLNSLSQDEQESINTPGCIQPHGVLLVLQEPELKILQVSANSDIILGIPPQRLISQNLSAVFEPSQIKKLKRVLQSPNLLGLNPVKLSFQNQESYKPLDGIVNRTDGVLILELEENSSIHHFSFLDFYQLIQNTVIELQKTESLLHLCEVAAHEFREIAQLDRVMVYQFQPQGHGLVIAEDKREDLESFVGLNYPASDIPAIARKLFSKNRVRLIPDVYYQPVSLIPSDNPLTEKPLDLGQSVLRSASSCHLKYLQNMGVRASLVVPILRHGELWGLIAGHHYSPQYFPYEVRAACEFFGQALSAELSAKESYESYDARLAIQDIQGQLLTQMTQADSFVEGLMEDPDQLLNLVSATGVAICLGDKIQTLGKTPSHKAIMVLLQWLEEGHFRDKLYCTDSLALEYPSAIKYKDVGSGLLAIAISQSQQKYILWFRPEVIQTVDWAGNLNDSTHQTDDGTVSLCPRHSFELWKEEVQLTCLPWYAYQIEAALDLRKNIISIVIRKADELAQLNQELYTALRQLRQVQTQLIQSEKMSSLGQMVAGIAHEINNPVNFIYGNLAHAEAYSQGLIDLVELYHKHYPQPHKEIKEEAENLDLEFLIEDLPKLLSSMQLGAERIREIVQSLRNFSRLDEADMKPVDIHEGIDSTLLILSNRLKAKTDAPSIQVIKKYGKIPPVECYPSQLNQVFMNLLANSIDAIEEYNHTRTFREIREDPSTILIETELVGQMVRIRIKDNGMGIPESVQAKLFDPFFTTKPVGKGTGMGLAISYQIITEKHQGTLCCISQPHQGAEFIIEIPLYPKSDSRLA